MMLPMMKAFGTMPTMAATAPSSTILLQAQLLRHHDADTNSRRSSTVAFQFAAFSATTANAVSHHPRQLQLAGRQQQLRLAAVMSDASSQSSDADYDSAASDSSAVMRQNDVRREHSSFPFLPTAAARRMMAEALAGIERGVGGEVEGEEESGTPKHVRHFESQDGKSKGSVIVRKGRGSSSKVKFMLQSWLYCPLPFATLRFATLWVFMSTTSDCPHLLVELYFTEEKRNNSHQTSGHQQPILRGREEEGAEESGSNVTSRSDSQTATVDSPAGKRQEAQQTQQQQQQQQQQQTKGGSSAARAKTSLIGIADLIPRKDLVADVDYLERYYEKSGLNNLFLKVNATKKFKPYIVKSTFNRAFPSPTALFFTIDDANQSEDDSLLKDNPMKELSTFILNLVEAWAGLMQAAEWTDTEGNDQDVERQLMLLRDQNIISHATKKDLETNLPRLFGANVTSEVLKEISRASDV